MCIIFNRNYTKCVAKTHPVATATTFPSHYSTGRWTISAPHLATRYTSSSCPLSNDPYLALRQLYSKARRRCRLAEKLMEKRFDRFSKWNSFTGGWFGRISPLHSLHTIRQPTSQPAQSYLLSLSDVVVVVGVSLFRPQLNTVLYMDGEEEEEKRVGLSRGEDNF